MEASRLRAVVIDDSDRVRELLCEIVRGVAGVEVVGEAADVESGVRLVEDLAPTVVTLDLQLNGGCESGMDALRRIKALPNPPIVLVLTDYPFASYRRQCMELGAEHFLDKASDIPKLVDVLRTYARGKDA